MTPPFPPDRMTTRLLALTPVIVLLAHYAAVLPHEFAHSFMAWALGLKSDPLAISWGGTSVANILGLIHIDENVDYAAALRAGLRWQVALVAFAGPGLANGTLFLITRALVLRRTFSGRPLLAYALFWFLFMNLANLYDYVPVRAFSPTDDVSHFRAGTGLSPWIVYAVAGYLVLAAIVDFYRRIQPTGLDASGIEHPAARIAVMVLSTLLLFGWFAVPGFFGSEGEIAHFIAGTSVLLIPVIILAAWRATLAPPANAWSAHGLRGGTSALGRPSR